MLEYTTNWVKGEVTQGWIMLLAGILFAIATYYIWKADTSFIRGMLIPLALVTLICLGYGSNLVWGRPAKAKALTAAYQQNAATTMQEETARLEKEAATYAMTINVLLQKKLTDLKIKANPHFFLFQKARPLLRTF